MCRVPLGVKCHSPQIPQLPGPLSPVNQLHFIPVDLGSPIVHCAVADPYVVIMSSEGQVTMFVLKSDTYGGRTHRLTLQKPQLHHVSETRIAPGGCFVQPHATNSAIPKWLKSPQQQLPAE